MQERIRMRGKDDCYCLIYTVQVFIRHADDTQTLWQTSSLWVGSEYFLSSKFGLHQAFHSLETSLFHFHST